MARPQMDLTALTGNAPPPPPPRPPTADDGTPAPKPAGKVTKKAPPAAKTSPAKQSSSPRKASAAQDAPGEADSGLKRINLSVPSGIADRLHVHADDNSLYLKDVVLDAYQSERTAVIADPGPRKRARTSSPLGLWYTQTQIDEMKASAATGGVSLSALIAGCLDRHLPPLG